jgi:7,8-dihydropterin-6-yl-methyl-4-(beta-D-ribofuranosyl)aminobenzene 5'-phosphate synthase
MPTVERLALTTAVDHGDAHGATAGQRGQMTVQRTGGASPVASGAQLLSEHGLASHLASRRRAARQASWRDCAPTERALRHHAAGLTSDPAVADARILSHGHDDPVSGLLPLLRVLQGRRTAERTRYAGGEDPFGPRGDVRPNGQQRDRGPVDRPALEARGGPVVLAKAPTGVAGHACPSGQIARVTDVATGAPAAPLEVAAQGAACAAAHVSP